jgi:hypothetical protein
MLALLAWGCSDAAPRRDAPGDVPRGMPVVPVLQLVQKRRVEPLPDCTPSWRLVASGRAAVVARVQRTEPAGTTTHRFVRVPTSVFRLRIERRLANVSSIGLPEILAERPDAPAPLPAPAEIATRLGRDEPRLVFLAPTRDIERWSLCPEDGCVLPATPEIEAALAGEVAAQAADARVARPWNASVSEQLGSAEQATRTAQALLDGEAASTPLLVGLLGDTRTVAFNRVAVTEPGERSSLGFSIGSVHGPGTVGELARALLEAITGERCLCAGEPTSPECDPARPACRAFWSVVAAKVERRRTGAPPNVCVP